MEKIDDGRSQGGVLELTCGTKIASFYGIFGMEIVDAKGEKQKNEEKREIETLSISSSHRIPNSNTISEKKGESQRLKPRLSRKYAGMVQSWILNPA